MGKHHRIDEPKARRDVCCQQGGNSRENVGAKKYAADDAGLHAEAHVQPQSMWQGVKNIADLLGATLQTLWSSLRWKFGQKIRTAKSAVGEEPRLFCAAFILPLCLLRPSNYTHVVTRMLCNITCVVGSN